MNKKAMMIRFIKKIERKKLLTLFIKNLFDYENLFDYNYLFRITEENDRVIIDIYDNISDNRFNRYIFIFSNGRCEIKTINESNVFVTYIYIDNIENSDNKLLKLGYLFKLDNKDMIWYAKDFLDEEFVIILEDIIKEPIYN